jgi:hypothetical protein
MNDEHTLFGIPTLAEKLGLPHPIWTLVGLLALLALAIWLVMVGLPVVDHYLPGGAVTTQGVLEVIWLADMRLGFLGHRQVYRQRYGQRAYQQAAVRFFLLAFVLMVVGLVRPAFVSGAPLYPIRRSVTPAGRAHAPRRRGGADRGSPALSSSPAPTGPAGQPHQAHPRTSLWQRVGAA